MEETKKYEPLRLKPCLRSYLWGGTRLRGEYHKTGEGVIAESWELSVRADGQTYIDSGEHCGESLADVLRADPVGMAGTRCGIAPFPLLIKLIDAQKDLSGTSVGCVRLPRKGRAGQDGDVVCGGL